MSKSIKLLFVTGPGGARMDFVAGWLGKLSNFIDTKWYIDSATGLSIGDMHFAKSLDYPNSDIQQVFSGNQATLSSQADVTWAGSCHGHHLTKFKNLIDEGVITLLNIDTSLADQKTIHWEFLVKTYLSKRQNITEFLNNHSNHLIDSQINRPADAITDQDRCEKFKELCKINSEEVGNISSELPCTTANYNELFKPGGSFYLCDLLGITTSLRNHDLWNDMLKYSTTPKSLEAWGETWVKENCIID